MVIIVDQQMCAPYSFRSAKYQWYGRASMYYQVLLCVVATLCIQGASGQILYITSKLLIET